MERIVIGIDTGVHTGLCIYDSEERSIKQICCVGIVKALDIVGGYAERHASIKVYFEDARQRKWIPREQSFSEVKGRAMGAGSVKRDCQIWEEFLTDRRIPFEKVAPRCNITKLSAEQFCKLSGWTGRTNEHSRDAAGLILGLIRNGKD